MSGNDSGRHTVAGRSERGKHSASPCYHIFILDLVLFFDDSSYFIKFIMIEEKKKESEFEKEFILVSLCYRLIL